MIFRSLFTTILVGLLIVSCGKDPIDPVDNKTKNIPEDELPEENLIEYPTPEQGVLSSFVNKDLWQSTEASAATSFNSIVISGVTDKNEIIVIKATAQGLGEYTLGGSQEDMLGYISSSNSYFTSKSDSGATGVLKILELNPSENWISGTFSATVYTDTNDSLQLNGNFEQLELTNFLHVLTLGNSMSSLANSTPWNASHSYNLYTANPGNFTLVTDSESNIETKFILPFDIGLGSYEIGISSAYKASLCVDNGCSLSHSGEITITAINRKTNRMEAIYSFVHNNPDNTSINITDGHFSIHYWYMNGLRP